MSNIFMRFPGGLSKALTLSYDDAVQEDVRLIDIMKQHGLKGTFNINSSQYVDKDFVYPPEKKWGCRMTAEKATSLYRFEEGFEPALHALTHPYLQSLPNPQVAYEIIKDRENLEAQFGRIVRGMAYPYGTYSDDVVEVLRHCGIVYSRTTKATENFDIPTDWLRLNPTCHHNNPHLNELAEKFVTEAPKANQSPWLFYLWGHAYEFERDNNWSIIEDFADKVGGKEDVWYATNIEIFEYIQSFHRLVFSLDVHRVQNPTAQEICFILHKKLYRIAPGATVELD